MKTIGRDPITAFNQSNLDTDANKIAVYLGLTKREYFAAMAMGDLIGKKHGHVDGFDGNGNCSDAIDCANLAVTYADALITALNKETT